MTVRSAFDVLLVLLALASCTAASSPVSVGCPEACDRMRVCKLGRVTTPGGATCEEVCATVTREGVDFGAACLVHAATCAEARACP